MANLQVGQKYTFVGFNDFGFLYNQQITIEEVQEKPYAQYEKALFLTYRGKKERKSRVKIILPHQKYIIWENWISPDTNMWGPTDGRTTKSKFLSFSDEYLKIAIASITEKPVVCNI